MLLLTLSQIIFLSQYEKVFANTPIPDEDCQCKYECTNVSKDMNSIMYCLSECGFAIIPNLYNTTILNQIRIKFFENFTDEERYEYLDRDCIAGVSNSCLSGNRYEHAMPHFRSIDGFDEIIYQPLIAETSMNFMKQQLIQYKGTYDHETNPIVLDTITFITAPKDTEDISQEFHLDGAFGIKLQIPLINVTKNKGPIEIVALEGFDIMNEMAKVQMKDCRIKGIVNVGTAILYQQNVAHRGTKNNHNNIRPVIDTSFLTLDEHREQNYFVSYTETAQNDMRKNQDIFYKYCDRSEQCPATRKTYCEKHNDNLKKDSVEMDQHTVDMFADISAKVREKVRDRAKSKAKNKARSKYNRAKSRYF